MEPAEARSQFDALRSDLPDALDPHITAMLDISKAAEGLALNDPQHPCRAVIFRKPTRHIVEPSGRCVPVSTWITEPQVASFWGFWGDDDLVAQYLQYEKVE
nr:hypothetical protein [Halomonas elongata]